jgi:hypothetical protein
LAAEAWTFVAFSPMDSAVAMELRPGAEHA